MTAHAISMLLIWLTSGRDDRRRAKRRPDRDTYTVGEPASRRWQCSQRLVLRHIASGELAASRHLATRHARPRWRITAIDVRAFEFARRPQPTTQPTRRRQAVAPKEYVRYFGQFF